MLRSQYFLFTSIAVLLAIMGIALAQNIALNEQIQSTDEDNQKLQHIINNYTDTFGDVSFSQDIPTRDWKLETNVFVASSLDELNPVTVVKANEQYSVTATVARPSGIADYPPLLGYVMYVQVLDQNDNRIAGSWHQDEIRVNQKISAGTYWMPANAGTYTIEVFAWQSFAGTPHAESLQIDVTVVD